MDDRFHHYSFSFILSRVEAIDDLDILVRDLRAGLRQYGKHVNIRIIGKNPVIPPEIYMAVIVGVAKEVGTAAGKAILSIIKNQIARFRKQTPAVVRSKFRDQSTSLATYPTKPRKSAKKKSSRRK